MTKRIILKLSGEALAGEDKVGINNEVIEKFAKEVRAIVENDIELAIVVGGGNFWRGRSSKDMDRVTADYIGMLATTMNCLAFADAIKREGLECLVLNALDLRKVTGLFTKDEAIEALEEGKVLLLAGGTGNPFFSTDSTAALRAAELEADIVLKATLVDGVYDKDPQKYDDAVMYKELTHDQILEQNLAVIDATCAALLRDSKIALRVFNIQKEGNILAAACGEDIGTLVQ